jgi:hypothetical protein
MVDIDKRAKLLLEEIEGRGVKVPQALQGDGLSASAIEYLVDCPHRTGPDAPPDLVPIGPFPIGAPRQKGIPRLRGRHDRRHAPELQVPGPQIATDPPI